MPTYLLRIEAVNFAWSCYDTNDISTIRGGSMLLMDAHNLVRDTLPIAVTHDPLVSGASQAIWEFNSDDDTSAEQVRLDVVNALANHKELQHATFVVDVLPNQSGGADDVQRLRMMNRWRQMQQPTLAVPKPIETNESGQSPYCEFDRVRPAVATATKGRDTYRVSESTKSRREYGKVQKQRFYKSRVSEAIHVVNDLDTLTKHPTPKHRLSGKMAVIYIDGNKQSEMASQFGLQQLQEFRSYVRDRHDAFLKFMLDEIAKVDLELDKSSLWHHWHEKDEQHQVRLETLLWGGDDIVLVVPAWQGWQVIEWFFKQSMNWVFNNERFTHAAGVVFCSYKSPIQHMRELADDLLIQGKKTQSQHGTYQDLVGYEVLESFDVSGSDIDTRRKSRLWCDKVDPDSIDPLLLNPQLDHLSKIADMVRGIREAVEQPNPVISRRKIESYARSMQDHTSEDTQIDGKIETYFGSHLPKIDELESRQKLYHLTALWDYIS